MRLPTVCLFLILFIACGSHADEARRNRSLTNRGPEEVSGPFEPGLSTNGCIWLKAPVDHRLHRGPSSGQSRRGKALTKPSRSLPRALGAPSRLAPTRSMQAPTVHARRAKRRAAVTAKRKRKANRPAPEVEAVGDAPEPEQSNPAPQPAPEDDPFLLVSPQLPSRPAVREASPEPPAPEFLTATPARRNRRANPAVLRVLAGSQVLNHSLGFNALAGTSLREYRAPLVIAPWFRAEGYPLALLGRGPLADLGVTFEQASAVGLKTRHASGTYPVSFSATDAGLRYRLFATDTLQLSPSLGFRLSDFSVAGLEGVPPLSGPAVRAGLEVEQGLGVVELFARADLLLALGLGPARDAPYNGRGGALGVSAVAGLTLALGEHVEALAQLQLTRFSLALHPDGAEGEVSAVDLSLGGAAAVRASF